MTNIRQTRLVQRLLAPVGTLDNPASYALGFTPDGEKIFSNIFTFDYMGAAEFEADKQARALSNIAKGRTDLRTTTIPLTIMVTDSERNGLSSLTHNVSFYRRLDETYKTDCTARDLRLALAAHDRPDTQQHEIYLIAPERLLAHATKFIEEEAQELPLLDEPTKLRQALLGFVSCQNVMGWLELDNGFMFFRDAAMFGACTQLLGIQNPLITAQRTTAIARQGQAVQHLG